MIIEAQIIKLINSAKVVNRGQSRTLNADITRYKIK